MAAFGWSWQVPNAPLPHQLRQHGPQGLAIGMEVQGQIADGYDAVGGNVGLKVGQHGVIKGTCNGLARRSP